MRISATTCWMLVQGASRGDSDDCDEFVRRYAPVVRASLQARWRGWDHLQEVDDAVQEVFIDCFREDGALRRIDSTRSGGFRAFLFGITRNVARRTEERKSRRREVQAPTGFALNEVEQRERNLSQAFDRNWAQSIMREALAKLECDATMTEGGSITRYDLLRLRFKDGMRVQEIAELRNVDPRILYRELGKAKDEYRDALLLVVSSQQPKATRAEIEYECTQLLDLLE